MLNKTYINSEFFKVATVDANNQVIGLITPLLQVTANATLGTVANVKINGGSNGQFLQTNGNGNLTWATPQTSNVSAAGNTGEIQFNSNGVFSASNLLSYSGGTLTVVNIVADGGRLGNLQAANIVGTVANATYSLNSANSNVANLANLATVANTANYANIAQVANTVAGANVGGTVANANYSLFAGTTNLSNFAGVANSVAGANVSGTVANANYSAFSGVVTTGAQPNITTVGTLISLTTGNITVVGTNATINLSATTNLTAVGSNLQLQGNTVTIQPAAVIPSSNLTGGLGTSTNIWSNVWTRTANITGNLTVDGVINRGGYRTGEVIRRIDLIQTGFNQAASTTVNNTTPNTVAYYLITPTTATSHFVIDYDTQWNIPGAGDDTWAVSLKWDATTFFTRQMTFTVGATGQRSSILAPVTGIYTPGSTAQANIQVQFYRVSSDDTLTIVNTASLPATLRITEVA